MSIIIGSQVRFNKETQLLGSAEEALYNKANTYMIYTGNNQSTERFMIDNELTEKAHKLMRENDINKDYVMVHAPFIINLANNKDERKYNFYISFMKKEIERCQSLGIKNLIFHPGSATDLTLDIALNNVVYGINHIMKNIDDFTLIIEFMSGKGSEVGKNIEELKYILENINCKDKVGICLDTCHMNDSNIDLNHFDNFLDIFDNLIGISKIKCIHINDSLNEMGAHKDRHANIGYGKIGFDTLLSVLYNPRLMDIPKILETPSVNGVSSYKYEIDMIKNQKFSDFISNL